MNVLEGIGFVIGLALGVVLFPYWFVRAQLCRTVTDYHATDREYGRVRIVVETNRLTGTKRRLVMDAESE